MQGVWPCSYFDHYCSNKNRTLSITGITVNILDLTGNCLMSLMAFKYNLSRDGVTPGSSYIAANGCWQTLINLNKQITVNIVCTQVQCMVRPRVDDGGC